MSGRQQLLLLVLVLLALIFFAGLLLAAQTVGGEAWHDSGPVPAAAFVAIQSAGVSTPAPALYQPPTAREEVRSDRVSLGSVTRAPSASRSVAALTGLASWYAYTPGGAAAGPALRVGDWRGRVVRVCTASACVVVTLTDSCQCFGTRLIDLDAAAFAALAPLSAGLVNVEVTLP